MTEQIIPNIVTYHSKNAKPHEAWLAYIELKGEQLLVRMVGSTEAAAIERAKNWWINESAHQARIVGRHEIEEDDVPAGPYKAADDKKAQWGQPTTPVWGKPTGDSPSGIGRGHGLAGKVWLINHNLKQKQRVDPSAVDAMLAEGWLKAGPRTSFKD